MVDCRTICELIEELAPPARAEQWDNIGLQLGEPDALVKSVLVSLDIESQVVEEAVAEGVDMIIAHHPFFFKPISHLRTDQPWGSMVKKLLKHDVMVYIAHTNLDNADEGINHYLADYLGLKNAAVLAPADGQKLYKLVVFVPKDNVDAVRGAISEAGGGWLGNYSHCTFQTLGEGSFKPLGGTKPYIGQVGELERVAEYRLETIVLADKLSRVLEAMTEAHPYEEVAYDVYPLANEGKPYGLGRVGDLAEAENLEAFARRVKRTLGCEQVRVVGDIQHPMTRVAVCGGSGASLVDHALRQKADVLVTGDLKFHEAQDAVAKGLAIVDAGHYATERIIVPVLARYLQEKLDSTKVIMSQENTNPWQHF
ncbi:Nif3-like dinuclear metal center hexameric protein [Metallumcola ferriviriculae]|uniref:GTP cyclohydrolase 1 type 2 homolog n=1 Tax=Metallumcola ferriviriculae TaxID=3039180 RepID=A0AAU0UL63_9FIRM|nr:Nif3-like dinuclear metal center hexameric protein [Desulfitibacteraceae bacterium MK1]